MRWSLIIPFLFFSICTQAQLDTLPAKAQLVGDVEANAYTVIYPLGWSTEGKFAYVYQDINMMGGAEIYDYHFIIQGRQLGVGDVHLQNTYNLEEDSTYWFVHDLETEDSTFWGHSFFTNVYWKENKDTLLNLLEEYNIFRAPVPEILELDKLKENQITLSVVRDRDTENAIILDRSIDIFIQVKGKQKRSIYSKTNALNEDGWAVDGYGNYTDLLYYDVQGFIRCPFSDHYLLYLVESTMGYEEAAERIILVPFSKNH